MIADLRHAVRALAKSPGYTAIALLTLALGIGVNTSMFSVVDTLLFRTAPFPEADQLIQLAGITRSGEQRDFSDQEIREILPQASGFSSLTALSNFSYAWSEPGQPAERLIGVNLSNQMMDTFRTQPMLGRPFAADEFESGKNQVVLLSESFWRSRFAGDPAVIGRTLRLDRETVTVIGVMPAHFDYKMLWGNVAFWRPLNVTQEQASYRGYRQFLLIGRLKHGTTPVSIAAQLGPLASTQEKDFPQDYPGLRYRAIPLHEAQMDNVGRGISWMLLGLSGFVLLIACANLANLQLARATASMRDFAIRAALGASRTRLIIQQLTECTTLSLTGGALGSIVALWINSFLERNILISGEPGFKFAMDGTVLLVTLLVSLATGALFGVVPALFASRADVSSALKSQSRGSTSGRGHHRLRHALIIGEVALALVLLGGAAIMNRGFAKLLERQVGWDTSRVITASLPIPESRYGSREKRVDFFQKLEPRLAALPGVEHVALATSLPLFNYTSDRQVFIDGPSGGKAENPVASHVMITADYFATMGIPLMEGRLLPPDLKVDGAPYILVNQTLARRFWPNESAVGKRLGVMESKKILWSEIIGVVGDVEPAANIANPPTALTVYKPLVQEPWSYVNIAVRNANPAALADSIRRAVADLDPDLPLDQLGTVREFVNRTQHNLIVVGQQLVGFALLGLVLAAVGLYGVISNLVAQRTSEFGIRLALGAQPRDIMANVLQRGMLLTVIGLIIGLAGAYALSRFLASFMPRLVSPDPLALGTVAALLFVVTLIACWLPARRATKVDPIIALRAE